MVFDLIRMLLQWCVSDESKRCLFRGLFAVKVSLFHAFAFIPEKSFRVLFAYCHVKHVVAKSFAVTK